MAAAKEGAPAANYKGKDKSPPAAIEQHRGLVVERQIIASFESDAGSTKSPINEEEKGKFAIKCFGCDAPLTADDADKGNVILSLGNFWHCEHFTCIHCRCTIGVDRRMFRECPTARKFPMCLDCFMETYHPRCSGCGKVLRESCVKALNKRWHQSCFTCTKCRGPFPRGEYYLYEGKPYDCDCYHLTKYAHLLEPEVTDWLLHEINVDVSPDECEDINAMNFRDGKEGGKVWPEDDEEIFPTAALHPTPADGAASGGKAPSPSLQASTPISTESEEEPLPPTPHEAYTPPPKQKSHEVAPTVKPGKDFAKAGPASRVDFAKAAPPPRGDKKAPPIDKGPSAVPQPGRISAKQAGPAAPSAGAQPSNDAQALPTSPKAALITPPATMQITPPRERLGLTSQPPSGLPVAPPRSHPTASQSPLVVAPRNSASQLQMSSDSSTQPTKPATPTSLAGSQGSLGQRGQSSSGQSVISPESPSSSASSYSSQTSASQSPLVVAPRNSASQSQVSSDSSTQPTTPMTPTSSASFQGSLGQLGQSSSGQSAISPESPSSSASSYSSQTSASQSPLVVAPRNSASQSQVSSDSSTQPTTPATPTSSTGSHGSLGQLGQSSSGQPAIRPESPSSSSSSSQSTSSSEEDIAN